MDAYLKSEISFQIFVKRVMLLNSMPISKLRLIYEYQHKSTPIRTWLNIAISDNIHELELDFCFYARAEPIHLPETFFTSKMLVIFKLSQMPLNVPSVVCFPSLKILELKKIVYSHDNCIKNLLSGCQVLEELIIEEIARDKPKAVDISIPTLRSFCFTYRFVSHVMLNAYKFLINAPNLEHFYVNGRISDVFEVLCESNNQNLPMFSNLERLEFGIGLDFCWKRMLMEFIKYSPSLEILMLNNEHGFARCMDELQKITPQPLPDNLLSYLKKIVVDDLYANFMPENIEYLAQHVNALTRLKILCRSPTMLGQIGFTS